MHAVAESLVIMNRPPRLGGCSLLRCSSAVCLVVCHLKTSRRQVGPCIGALFTSPTHGVLAKRKCRHTVQVLSRDNRFVNRVYRQAQTMALVSRGSVFVYLSDTAPNQVGKCSSFGHGCLDSIATSRSLSLSL